METNTTNFLLISNHQSKHSSVLQQYKVNRRKSIENQFKILLPVRPLPGPEVAPRPGVWDTRRVMLDVSMFLSVLL